MNKLLFIFLNILFCYQALFCQIPHGFGGTVTFFENILTLKKIRIDLTIPCDEKNIQLTEAMASLNSLVLSQACSQNPCTSSFCPKKMYKYILNSVDAPECSLIYKKPFATSARLLDCGRLIISSWHPSVDVIYLNEDARRDVLSGHVGSVWKVFKLDSALVASVSDDGGVKIWDLEKNDCKQSLFGHEQGCKAALFLKNKKLVTASGSGRIYFWSGYPHRLKKTMRGHDASVCALAELGNDILISSSFDRTIKIWDTKCGFCIQTIKDFNDCAYALVKFSQHEFIAALDNHTIIVCDVRSGTIIRKFVGHTSCVRSLVLLGNFFLASASMDGTIKLWDVWSGRCIQTIRCGMSGIISLSLLGNGNLLAVSVDGSIYIVDLYPSDVRAIFQEDFDSVEKLKKMLLVIQLNLFWMGERQLVLHCDWKNAFESLPEYFKQGLSVFFCA